MALEMIRIDDRFIHGQVVVGWCPHLKPDRLILCDNEIAESEWECELYQDASQDYATSICTIEKTIELLNDQACKREKLFLIVSSPHVLVELVRRGASFDRVVVGGMHYETGKRKIANYIYINDADLEDFRFLVEHNIQLEGKDLPACKPINIGIVLGLN